MYQFEVDAEREFCNCSNLMNCANTFAHQSGDNEFPYYTVEVFKIFICPACNEATLICYSTLKNIDDDEFQRDDTEVELYRLYSRKVLQAPKKQLHSSIPRPIAEVAHQAQSVLTNSPRASFILCRAVLEEICNDFKIPTEDVNNKGKIYFINLHKRLAQLFVQEKMSEDLIDIIHGIRELGNEGAHSDHLTFAKQVKAQDVDSLLLLVNHVIERLYVDKYRQHEAGQVLKQLKEKVFSLEVEHPSQ